MRYLLFIVVSFACVFYSTNANSQGNFFDNANTFFEANINSGNVNYQSIANDPLALNQLVNTIESYDLTEKANDEQLAFYLNAYNVLVIKQVVDNYPLKSPMDVSGFFDGNTYIVAGKSVTLNDIENNIIRPTFNDARIHFALVCGAKGCPPITNQAFTVENVNERLDKLTSDALNNGSFLRIDEANAQVLISEIFKWYIVDFGNEIKGVKTFINQYRSTSIPDSYNVDFYTYDWNLNE